MSPSTLEATLAALADPTRRGVVDLLRREPRRAGEIANALGMTAAAMSRHLRVLRKSGLVEEESLDADARVRVYRLKREPFALLRDWLNEVESFWTLQLGSFKEHAERTRRKKAQ
jgi:DNA-binding transcriptional ArsR family regulator